MALIKSNKGRVQIGTYPNIYAIVRDAYTEVPDEIACNVDTENFQIIYNDINNDSKATRNKNQEKIISKPVQKEKIQKDKSVLEQELYKKTKEEQIDMLKKFNMSDKLIQKLKYEKDRVNALLKFV